MNNWISLGMALIGCISIYLGYKLFCDGTHGNRSLTAFVAGALLAVFGLGILLSEIRGIEAPRQQAHRRFRSSRATEEGSFHAPERHVVMNTTERFI